MRRVVFGTVCVGLLWAGAVGPAWTQDAPKTTAAAKTEPATTTEAPLPPGAERTKTGKIVYRGRLPNGWGKLGILADQKQKIYKVQAEYNAKIEELERQIEELRTQRDAAMIEQLTDNQKTQLKALSAAN